MTLKKLNSYLVQKRQVNQTTPILINYPKLIIVCLLHCIVRIKGRLRNLIARRPQVETLKKTGIMQGMV